jgi:hypothetical protein
MPPLCITIHQLMRAVEAIRASIIEVCGRRSGKARPQSELKAK